MQIWVQVTDIAPSINPSFQSHLRHHTIFASLRKHNQEPLLSPPSPPSTRAPPGLIAAEDDFEDFDEVQLDVVVGMTNGTLGAEGVEGVAVLVEQAEERPCVEEVG